MRPKLSESIAYYSSSLSTPRVTETGKINFESLPSPL